MYPHTTTNPHPPHLLLVDDQPLDVELTLLGLAEHHLHQHVTVLNNGHDALDHLCRHAGHPSELPDLLLLDLNMPGLHGQEVLRQVKAHPDLRHLPVVMLTTSDRPQDRAACSDADAYLVKPLHLSRFASTVGAVVVDLLRRSRPPRHLTSSDVPRHAT